MKKEINTMPQLITGSFLTNSQVEKLKDTFKDFTVVVRCKDCKWRSEKGFCKHPDGGAGNIRPENWFCADGKRRETND